MPDIPPPNSFPLSPPIDLTGPEKRCDLCGLPLGRSRLQKIVGEEVLRFCCPGCEQVFSLLAASPGGVPVNFRETELYRVCVESGIIPQSPGNLAAEEGGGRGPGDPAPAPSPSLSLDLNLRVGGMWCPACSWLIEEVLRRTRGVREPRVSFFSDLVELKYLPHLISPAEVLERISHLGYRPSLFLDEEISAREKLDLQVRLGISSILTLNVMMLSFALYFGFFRELSSLSISYFSYPLWLMATPVVFYGGLPILKKGMAGLRYRTPTMESLILVGSLAAYFYSLLRMAQGSLHLYFDTASMLITLVLLGRYIETHAREKVSRGIRDLYGLSHQKVRLLDGEKERWVAAEAVQKGDEFRVLAGERTPLDGKISSGRGNVDESILTGESRPLHKGPGDGIMAGALLLSGEMRIRATHLGRESSLHQMITLMEQALSRKNPVEVLADRITRWFVPAILAMAGATGVFLWLGQSSLDEVFLRSVTVLVISCPCALGIAMPIAKVAAIGRAKSKGILVRDPAAMERAKDLDTLVFDKTGTLTEGNFSLREVVTDEGIPEEQVLSLLASVEAYSDHFLAGEILRKAREKSINIEESEGFEAFDGMGAKGLVGGKEIFVGNRRLMEGRNLSLPGSLEKEAQKVESEGMTAVFFGWEEKVRGLLVFGDSLREGVREMVKRLQAKGIATWIVSGDAQETTQAIAQQSGIPNCRGQTLPQEKVEFIKRLQGKGHLVGMVGDGINDAAALARADVGFSIGRGVNILREASDITFLAPDPSRVLEVFDLSTLTGRTIRQNLFFAFLYNSIGIPIAMAGWLNPLVAVLAMFASSLTVIGNAYRISRNSLPSANPPGA